MSGPWWVSPWEDTLPVCSTALSLLAQGLGLWGNKPLSKPYNTHNAFCPLGLASSIRNWLPVGKVWCSLFAKLLPTLPCYLCVWFNLMLCIKLRPVLVETCYIEHLGFISWTLRPFWCISLWFQVMDGHELYEYESKKNNKGARKPKGIYCLSAHCFELTIFVLTEVWLKF